MKQLLDKLIIVLSIVILFFLCFYALYFWESPNRIVLIYLPLFVVLWGFYVIKNNLLFPNKSVLNYIFGLVTIIVAVITAYYLYSEYYLLIYERGGNNNLLDLWVGGVFLVFVLLATWKETGVAVPAIFAVFTIYAFLGKYLPADNFFRHAGLSFRSFMSFSVLAPDGIFGLLTKTAFNLVTIFVFFAGIIKAYGGLEYVIELAKKVTSGRSWGLPQLPVISSMIFGSFSGSAAGNVAGTGSITIPMLKRFGIPGKIAGAIEAVASSGGQVMPPMMGVAAFLMAEILGVHYINIVAMAVVPAVVFYFSVAFAVHLSTQSAVESSNISSEYKNVDKSFSLVDGLPLLLSIIALLMVLAYYRSAVIVAGFWTIIVFLVVRLLINFVQQSFTIATIVDFLKTLLEGIVDGARSSISIMLLLASMGVVAKMLTVTGLSQKLSFLLFNLGEGQLFLLLVLLFFICLMFGMVVATVVSYLLVVMLAVPAMSNLGIPQHVSHFVILYLAQLSAITPPVALAVGVAAPIAGSSFWKTGVWAVKIGISLFILPFVFIFKPGILDGNAGAIYQGVLVLIGMLGVIYAINSRSKGRRSYLIKILMGGLGLVALFSTTAYVYYICLAAIIVLGLAQVMRYKNKDTAVNL